MTVNRLLKAALRPITVIVGHYGVGKTNFAVNLALDLAAEGNEVTLIDLDVVNPYFRATEQRRRIEEGGVKLIAPIFAEAGSSLDSPSLSGAIAPALDFSAGQEDGYVIVDAGGDDVGATALGRFSAIVKKREYAMLYVVNEKRSMTQTPREAVEILREIEVASHLNATGIVSNAHLKAYTEPETIESGARFAREVARNVDLELVSVASSLNPKDCSVNLLDTPSADDLIYDIDVFVRAPWE